MSPLISIIVPVYNSEAFLRRCFDSIRCQTYSNFEVICVNDGSTDNSMAILHEYEQMDARFKILSQKNKGQGAARNIAIEHAKGIWITGIDSDDYIEPDTLEYVLSHDSSDVHVIQYGIKNITENVNSGELKFVEKRGSHTLGKHRVTPFLLINQPCEFWGKFWRKSFLDKYKCRFPESYWYEDWFFYWAYMPFAEYVLSLPECKYAYIIRPSSTMGLSKQKAEKTMDHIKVLKCLCDYRSRHPLSKSFACLNIINFLECQSFISNNIPEYLMPVATQMFEELSFSPCMEPWQGWLQHLRSHRKSVHCFMQYYAGKKVFSLFGIPILSMHIEWDYFVLRLFGKRIYRKKLWR